MFTEIEPEEAIELKHNTMMKFSEVYDKALRVMFSGTITQDDCEMLHLATTIALQEYHQYWNTHERDNRSLMN